MTVRGVPNRLKDKRLSSSHIRAPKQEKATAERIGGVTVKASGSGPEKGDVRLRGVARIENKTTKNNSFSVTIEHLDKLDKAVLGTNEVPMMQIELASGARSFIVIPDVYLESVINILKENNSAI